MKEINQDKTINEVLSLFNSLRFPPPKRKAQGNLDMAAWIAYQTREEVIQQVKDKFIERFLTKPQPIEMSEDIGQLGEHPPIGSLTPLVAESRFKHIQQKAKEVGFRRVD